MVFVRLPQGNIFLATIDMVGPVSSTPRYSRPLSRIRTQNTRPRAPLERPRQNAAGQVTSNPLFRNLRAILMKRLLFFFKNRVRDSSQKVLRRPAEYTTSDPHPQVTGQEVGR